VFPFFQLESAEKIFIKVRQNFFKQCSIDPGPIFDHDRDRDEKNLRSGIPRYPLRFREGGKHIPRLVPAAPQTTSPPAFSLCNIAIFDRIRTRRRPSYYSGAVPHFSEL
jgi:hypothetical protein